MMNIRIMGSHDLVKAWKEALEREYGIVGSIYANRGGGTDIRAYFNLDDRQAARIVGLSLATEVEVTTDLPPKSRASKRSPRLKG